MAEMKEKQKTIYAETVPDQKASARCTLFDESRPEVMLNSISNDAYLTDILMQLKKMNCRGVFAKCDMSEKNQREFALSDAGFHYLNSDFVTMGYGASLDLNELAAAEKEVDRKIPPRFTFEKYTAAGKRNVQLFYAGKPVASMMGRPDGENTIVVSYQCETALPEEKIDKVMPDGRSCFEVLLIKFLAGFRYGGLLVFENTDEKKAASSLEYFEEFEETKEYHEWYIDLREKFCDVDHDEE